MSFDHAVPDHWTNSSSSHLARDFRDGMEMLEGSMEVERCDTSNSFEGSSVRPVGYRGIPAWLLRLLFAAWNSAHASPLPIRLAIFNGKALNIFLNLMNIL